MRVYDRCAATTYALALQLVGHAEAAEAVIEEVFLALWRNPDAALSEPSGVQEYLARSVRQRALRQGTDARVATRGVSNRLRRSATRPPNRRTNAASSTSERVA